MQFATPPGVNFGLYLKYGPDVSECYELPTEPSRFPHILSAIHDASGGTNRTTLPNGGRSTLPRVAIREHLVRPWYYNDGQFSPPAAPAIKEDATWSPDGTKIVFTSHPAVSAFCTPSGTCNYPDTEIYTVNPDGTGLTQLTHNNYEERAPAWSPDGLQIVYMCRIGPPNKQTGLPTFEICVVDANGDRDGIKRLTWNGVLDATPAWSPDGTQIVFHRNPPPFQLWVVKADTSCVQNPDQSISCSCPSGTYPTSGKCEMQLTNTTGIMNGFPDWGEVRMHVK